MKDQNEERGLRVSNRDFKGRWHLATFGIVTVSLFAVYFISKKLIFG
jgi:hypothetical protein